MHTCHKADVFSEFFNICDSPSYSCLIPYGQIISCVIIFFENHLICHKLVSRNDETLISEYISAVPNISGFLFFGKHKQRIQGNYKKTTQNYCNVLN